MPVDRRRSRRHVFRGTIAVFSVIVLAGCPARPGPDGGSPDVTPAPVPATASPTPGAPNAAVIELVDFAFEPGTIEPVVVPTGTTVRFVWITQAHNIRVDAKPAASEWRGHEPIEDAGAVHEHSFDVPGRYEFHCEPHQSLGMEGTIIVE